MRARMEARRRAGGTLEALLAARSAAAAETFLVDRGRPLGAEHFAERAARLAGGLAALGVGRGDRIALWLPDVAAWLETFFACARLGAIAVAVNTRFRATEVSDVLARAGCRVLVFAPRHGGSDYAEVLEGCERTALAGLSALVAWGEDGSEPAPVAGLRPVAYERLARAAPACAAGRPEDGCVVFTTSGTTSRPKFVLHDQRTVVRHAYDVAHGFGYATPQARVLVSAPLCGVFGFTNAMAALAGGAPAFLLGSFEPERAAQAVREHRVTHTHASDEMIARMLEAAPAGEAVFPSARFFGYAAFSPARAALPAEAERRRLTLVGLYGMSEVHALIARRAENEPLERRARAGGRLIAPQGRVRARDPASGRLLAHGEAGELELAVPSRMVGYLNDARASAAAFTDDGYFRTGDLGYTESDTSFVFLARMGDALRLGGYLVNPTEIEEALCVHASVAAAQVVGVETARGLRAFAFVIPATGAAFDEATLLAHCRARLAPFKVPIAARPLAAFPVAEGANATKVQKAKLREWARASLAGGAR